MQPFIFRKTSLIRMYNLNRHIVKVQCSLISVFATKCFWRDILQKCVLKLTVCFPLERLLTLA